MSEQLTAQMRSDARVLRQDIALLGGHRTGVALRYQVLADSLEIAAAEIDRLRHQREQDLVVMAHIERQRRDLRAELAEMERSRDYWADLAMNGWSVPTPTPEGT